MIAWLRRLFGKKPPAVSPAHLLHYTQDPAGYPICGVSVRFPTTRVFSASVTCPGCRDHGEISMATRLTRVR